MYSCLYINIVTCVHKMAKWLRVEVLMWNQFSFIAYNEFDFGKAALGDPRSAFVNMGQYVFQVH